MNQTNLAVVWEKLNDLAAALFPSLLYYFCRHLRKDDFNHEVVTDVIVDLWANLIASARKRSPRHDDGKATPPWKQE